MGEEVDEVDLDRGESGEDPADIDVEGIKQIDLPDEREGVQEDDRALELVCVSMKRGEFSEFDRADEVSQQMNDGDADDDDPIADAHQSEQRREDGDRHRQIKHPIADRIEDRAEFAFRMELPCQKAI